MNSIEDLEIYLKQLQIESFPIPIEEINEPLITACDIVGWTIRDQCTVIEISAARLGGKWAWPSPGISTNTFDQ